MKIKNIYKRQWITLSFTALLAVLTNSAVIYSLFPEQATRELVLITSIILVLALIILNLLHQYIVKRAEAITATEYLDFHPLSKSFPLIATIIEKERDQFRQELGQLTLENRELHHLSTHDSLTTLKNRHAFQSDIQQYQAKSDTNAHGILCLIRATELANINQQLGRDSGDQYLKMIAEILLHVGQRFSSDNVYRLSGSDYALFITNAAPSIAPLIGKELKELFDHLQIKMTLASTASTGITFISPGESIEQIMSRADFALAKSQVSHINNWFIQEFDADTPLSGEMHWRDILVTLIETKNIAFTGQLIQPLKLTQQTYMQLHPAFMSADHAPLSADSLYSIAMRHSLMQKLEQILIKQMIEHFRAQPTMDQFWGINLSANALFDTQFMMWLERLLQQERDVAARLVFELNEDYLELHRATAIRLFEVLHECGSRTCISKFGRGLSSFYLYRELTPDYVKLDISLLDAIEETPTTQQFIKMLIDTVHKAGSAVIVEGIETRQQKERAEQLFVDGIQGSLCSRTTAIH